MINRTNWRDVQAHLTYRREVYRDSKGTLATRETALRLMLQWADATLLSDAPKLRPTWPKYLDAYRRQGKPLSTSTQKHYVSFVRTFFLWAVSVKRKQFKQITPLWLDTLQAVQQPTAVEEREVYTLDEVRSLLAVDGDGLAHRRIQATVAMLFLSGMRIGAYTTLPIQAVTIEDREVRQWTALGVKTKLGKSATTYLLDIPELLKVVQAWDELVRAELPPAAMWYPNLARTPKRERLAVVTDTETNRNHSIYRDLRSLCDAAGIPYKSPHKLRHGFVMHAVENARGVADLKAISMNVMHANLGVTDGVYGVLQDHDVSARVGRLGGAAPAGVDNDALAAQLEALLRQIKGDL